MVVLYRVFQASRNYEARPCLLKKKKIQCGGAAAGAVWMGGKKGEHSTRGEGENASETTSQRKELLGNISRTNITDSDTFT